MATMLARTGTLTGLLCLIAGGCSSASLGTAFDPPAPPVPAGVAAFTQTTYAAQAPAKKNAEGETPKASIRLAQAEEALPAPKELIPPDPYNPDSPRLKLDLGGTLALVSGRNPRVAFAQAQVQEAFGRLLQADVLWLPTIRAGFSYNRHDGAIQESSGKVDSVSRSTMETGLGLGAVGTGTPPVPGLSTRVNVGEAIFSPGVIRNEVNARQAAFTATLNDTLLSAALAYLDLLDAYQQRAITLETVANARKMTKFMADFAKAGQGTKADAERARTELGIRLVELERSNEAIQIASARLLEILNINTLTIPEPQEPTIVPIGLIPIAAHLPDLVAAALSNRPELAESRSLVSAAVQALKQQQFAPLIPSVLLGVSDSDFGGGPNNVITHVHNRADFDAVIFWEVRNMGFGEVAAKKQFEARLRQARLREVQVMDRVAREVAEDYARVQTKHRQIAIAAEAVKSAEKSYELNFNRVFGTLGLPIELLQSIQALDQARREYLRAVSDYDRAQFRLYRDLGWPPQ